MGKPTIARFFPRVLDRKHRTGGFIREKGIDSNYVLGGLLMSDHALARLNTRLRYCLSPSFL